MTPERWHKVKEIFQSALIRRPSERPAFLTTACGGDNSLRREVESLLVAHERDGSFIDSPASPAVAGAAPEFHRGKEFGHYQIVSRIGAGGMSEVYLADDTRLHRKVALKILPSDLAANKDRIRRFEQEAKAAAALNHPNIATIHEIGEHNGIHFIAMEFIDGQTLRQIIHREQFELGKLLRHLQHVAEGLAKAHAAGIVHRDLKPENIMVTRDGHAKILDFGLAKLIAHRLPQNSQSSQVTTALMAQQSTPGVIMGTVGYMSPEQAQGKTKEIDQRSDIFSFGCILFEAITGQRAFQGKDTIDSLNKIIREPVRPLSDFRSDAPNHLQRIVRRCLAKEPDERFQTVKDVAIELKNLRRELSDGAVPDTTVPPTRTDTGANEGQSTSPGGAAVSAHSSRPLSAEYIVSRIKARPLSLILAILVLVAAGAGIGLLLHARNTGVTIDSIAVLPFQNGSGDPNIEYLSDGISEALINSLTELHQLRVIARTTTFRYKGRDIDPLQVGRDLSVRSVLTGSVRQAGENLAIQVDLVDATTGTELWGQQYERKASDLLSIKQAIAREVSDNLRLRLSGDEQKQLTKRDTTSGESFQSYLRGRYYWNKRTPDSLKKAIEEFQDAIDRDPSFALGYVGLADTYMSQEHFSGLASREMLPKARAAVDRALAIDNSLAEAHATSASLYQHEWRWAEAESEFKRAIRLNPNYPTGHHFYGYYFYVKRQFDAAAREINRAHELDPLSPVISENIAMVQLLMGNFDAAIEQGEKTISLDPKFADAHYVLAFAYLKRGRAPEATAEFEKAVELSNRAGTYLGDLGYCYAMTDRRAEALAIAKELEEKFSHGESSGLFVAGVYAGLGDKDKAFAWLNKDLQQRSGQLPTVTWRPLFESLRSDPRYAELVGSLGL